MDASQPSPAIHSRQPQHSLSLRAQVTHGFAYAQYPAHRQTTIPALLPEKASWSAGAKNARETSNLLQLIKMDKSESFVNSTTNNQLRALHLLSWLRTTVQV